MKPNRAMKKSRLCLVKKLLQLAKRILENSRERIGTLLFPSRCPVCDEILTPEQMEKGIHPECESKFYPVEGAVCMHCGRPLGQYNPHRKMEKRQKRKNDSPAQSVKSMEIEQDEEIKQHLEIESTYEYCYECKRKGYVSVYDKRQLYGRGMDAAVLKPISCITQAKSLYCYRGAIKSTMYRFKYANKREYAAFFAQQAVKKYGWWLGVNAPSSSPMPHIDVIIPVPMYLPKQKLRGYNQAEVFAKELSRLTGIPVDRDFIQRTKDTTPQKELNDLERKNNLKNAFQKGKSIVQYSQTLIVDDIYTTGNTVEAVAKEIRKQGVHQVYVLSICIGENI